jgi:hypothetical protein
VKTLLVLFALLIAAPAAALDPECDPASAGFFDLAANVPYVVEDRTLRFCTPRLLVSGGALDDESIVRCEVGVDGVPYAALTTSETGAVVELGIDTSGQVVVSCIARVLDSTGAAHEMSSSAIGFAYEVVPRLSTSSTTAVRSKCAPTRIFMTD